MNFYFSLVNNEDSLRFFSFLTDLYSSCEFNYSSDCTSTVLQSYQVTYNLSASPLVYSKSWQSLSPFYTINSIPYFWPGSLESTYCLSLDSPSSNCESCSIGCSSADLASSICTSACNVSSCGFCNVKGLQYEGCYTFLLGGGTCDSQSYYDIDCFTHDTCADGCLHSGMRNNTCEIIIF